jgi:hypothetical protein
MRSRQLFRQSLIQADVATRSGGGWSRPDVPLIVHYKHRRVLNLFDLNLWYYCGVSPEYYINQSTESFSVYR